MTQERNRTQTVKRTLWNTVLGEPDFGRVKLPRNGGAAHDKLFELEMPAETQFSTLKLNPKPYKRYKPYKPDKPFKPKKLLSLKP